MKFISKINRGVILTSVIILGVIIYLVSNSVIQNNEKPRIKQICDTYLQTHIKFSMLPEKYRVSKPSMTTTEFNAYIKEMENEIKAFFPSNEQYSKYTVDNLKANLIAQSVGEDVVYLYTKNIVRYEEIIFDGKIVDVRFSTNTTTESKAINSGDSDQKVKMSQETVDNIILQQIDGVWKVIYANINRPAGNNPEGMGYPVK